MSTFSKNESVLISQSFNSDLALVGNSSAIKNKDVYEYFSYQILNANCTDGWSQTTLCELVTVLEGKNGYKKLSNRIASLVKIPISNSSSVDYSVVGRIIFCLFSSAALKGLVTLPSNLMIASAFKNNFDLMNGFPFSFCFARDVIELLNVSTPKRYAESKAKLKNKWINIEAKLKASNTWRKSCNDIATVMVRFGMNSFNKLDVEKFALHRVEVMDSKLACSNFANFFAYYDSICGTSYSFDYELYVSKNQVSSRGSYQSNSLGMSGYTVSTSTTAQNLAGLLLPANIMVFSPMTVSKKIEIGNFSFSLSELSDYSTDSIGKQSLWIDSQKDYINSVKHENSTRKSISSRLRYFNIYLYGYLPSFFSSNKTIFKFPTTPEMFQRHVFVEFSNVIDRSISQPASSKIYPMSIVDFITIVAEKNSKDSVKSKNLSRGIKRTVKLYFDFIINQYSTLKGFNITSNPFNSLKLEAGKGYSKSNKQRFQLEYWIYFRIFIKETAKYMLLDTLQRVYTGYLDLGDKTKASQCLEDIDEAASLLGITSDKERFKKPHNLSNYLEVNRPVQKIDWKPLLIDGVDLADFQMRKLTLNDVNSEVAINDYQRFVIVAVACYAGQRASNAAWIDSERFDKHVDYSQLKAGDPVTIFIDTDKVQTEGLDSVVPYEIFQILRVCRIIKSYNHNPSFKKPIYYQNNPDSVFGKISPLVQTTDINTSVNYNLCDLQKVFEKALDNSGIEYKSCLFLGHRKFSPKEFDHFRRNRYIPRNASYKISYDNGVSSTEFSSINSKSMHTIHSLRTQLVSSCDVILEDNDLIRMMTGQADATIGYYSTNTPDQESELREYKNKGKIEQEVMPVENPKKIKEEYKKSIDNNSFHEDFGAISSLPPSYSSTGLEDIKNIHPDELAFNWTHVCSTNNVCTDEVIKEVGEKQCHLCFKAVISKHNLPAIAALVKSKVEEVCELNTIMQQPDITDEDRSFYQHRVRKLTLEASSWKVRHDYILKNKALLIGDKDKIMPDIRYIPPDSIKEKFLARLIETKNAPALQSNRLRIQAERLARNLAVKISRSGEQVKGSLSSIKYDPVKFTLHNLEYLAELEQCSAQELLDNYSKGTTSQLDFFD